MTQIVTAEQVAASARHHGASTLCPRCHEAARRVGSAMDGCPEYLCLNSHLTHSPECPS